MVLKSSLVILQAFKTSAASLTSVASAASVASTASTAIFSQRISWSSLIDHPWHQNDRYWSLFMESIIKSPIVYSFCQRLLRPAYVTFLKTGWWNSKVQTSKIHRYLHFYKKVVFSWPLRSSKYVYQNQSKHPVDKLLSWSSLKLVLEKPFHSNRYESKWTIYWPLVCLHALTMLCPCFL